MTGPASGPVLLDDERALVDALRVDGRLRAGWDADRDAYGLYDPETHEFLAHGQPGQQLDRVDFTVLRARLLLQALHETATLHR